MLALRKINILPLPNKNNKNKNGKVLLSFLLYITVVDHAPQEKYGTTF